MAKRPAHLVVSETGEVLHYADKTGCDHGSCTPVDVIAQYDIKAVVCMGLGRGAFFKLRELGIEVFQTRCETVDEALAAFKAHQLAPMGEDGLCNHNHEQHEGHEHSCH